MEEQIYPYQKEYYDEVSRRFYEGGYLYFIERTDTHEFLYSPWRVKTSNDPYYPDEDVAWTNTIDMMNLGHAYLTKEDAEKFMPKLTTGGCRYCNHNSEPIPYIISEHEFINTKNG